MIRPEKEAGPVLTPPPSSHLHRVTLNQTVRKEEEGEERESSRHQWRSRKKANRQVEVVEQTRVEGVEGEVGEGEGELREMGEGMEEEGEGEVGEGEGEGVGEVIRRVQEKQVILRNGPMPCQR